jgi:hypothetical protein
MHAHSLGIVDVQHAPNGPQQVALFVRCTGRRDASAGVTLQARPPIVLTAIDIHRCAMRLREELRERRLRQPSQVLHQSPPLGQPSRIAEVSENDLFALAIELDVTTRGEEREPALDLTFEPAAPAIDERTQPAVELELPVLLSDEIDDRQVRLALGAAQPAPKLLGEHRGAVRGAQQQDRVDAGDVDALAEHIDREHGPEVTDLQASQRGRPLGLGCLTRKCDRRESGSAKPVRHELGVLDGNAEAERAHPSGLCDDPSNRLE